MKLDPIVLGKDYMLDGSEVGVLRPNDNVLADACSGCGKSKSLLFPTMARMEHMNPVALYAKEEDAYHMAAYMQAKGYQIEFLNVNCRKRVPFRLIRLLILTVMRILSRCRLPWCIRL